jgi:hypothetical protein
MYTKFELPNKKIKTMAKKGRKKSVNPKKNQKKERERADSSSRCFLKTRRSQTQICELSYGEISFPKLQEQSNKIGHRSLLSSSRPFACVPCLKEYSTSWSDDRDRI